MRRRLHPDAIATSEHAIAVESFLRWAACIGEAEAVAIVDFLRWCCDDRDGEEVAAERAVRSVLRIVGEGRTEPLDEPARHHLAGLVRMLRRALRGWEPLLHPARGDEDRTAMARSDGARVMGVFELVLARTRVGIEKMRALSVDWDDIPEPQFGTTARAGWDALLTIQGDILGEFAWLRDREAGPTGRPKQPEHELLHWYLEQLMARPYGLSRLRAERVVFDIADSVGVRLSRAWTEREMKKTAAKTERRTAKKPGRRRSGTRT